MSTAALQEKLTFDHRRLRAVNVRLAISCREAARRHPEIARPLRAKMRMHALQARGRLA